MQVRIVEGDLLDQPVEAIVNAWNRNIIPWWLLIPQGVSGAIKKRAGYASFRELGRKGPIKLGGAVMTSAGKLPYRAIIHVAGINLCWFATRYSIEQSVFSAMEIVNQQRFKSIAFPIIGAGSGSFNQEKSLKLMQETFERIESSSEVSIIKFVGR